MSRGTVVAYPAMEETAHEHRNIAMIRRPLEVYNSGDHNAMP
jgi:hypothetical protein